MKSLKIRCIYTISILKHFRLLISFHLTCEFFKFMKENCAYSFFLITFFLITFIHSNSVLFFVSIKEMRKEYKFQWKHTTKTYIRILLKSEKPSAWFEFLLQFVITFVIWADKKNAHKWKIGSYFCCIQSARYSQIAQRRGEIATVGTRKLSRESRERCYQRDEEVGRNLRVIESYDYLFRASASRNCNFRRLSFAYRTYIIWWLLLSRFPFLNSTITR